MTTNSSVLLLTNYDDVDSDWMIHELQRLEVDVIRWHPDEFLSDCVIDLGPAAARVLIRSSGKEFTSDQLRSVWFRRPKRVQSGASRPESIEFEEKEGSAAVEAFYSRISATWYSEPDSIRRLGNKIRQLDLARRLHFEVPEFRVCADIAKMREFLQYHSSAVVKTINASNCVARGNGLAAPLRARRITDAFIDRLAVAPFPFFIQQEIEKVADLRVTVIGERMFPVIIPCSPDGPLDSRVTWGTAEHMSVSIDDDLVSRILRFQRAARLNYGAFDFVIDRDSRPWFLECNPVGQFSWIDERLNLGMRESLARHLAGMEPALVQ